MITRGVWAGFTLACMWLVIAIGASSQSMSQGTATNHVWPPPDENPQIFPAGVFGRRENLAMVYAWTLRSMAEKPLNDLVSRENPQVFRLLTFVGPYNAPVVVRLAVRASGTGALAIKLGRNMHQPQIVILNRLTEASAADVSKFLKLLDGSNFWFAPTVKPADPHGGGWNGARDWTLEGRSIAKYRVVERVEPELGHLRDPVMFLVEGVAKVDLKSLPLWDPGRK